MYCVQHLLHSAHLSYIHLLCSICDNVPPPQTITPSNHHNRGDTPFISPEPCSPSMPPYTVINALRSINPVWRRDIFFRGEGSNNDGVKRDNNYFVFFFCVERGQYSPQHRMYRAKLLLTNFPPNAQNKNRQGRGRDKQREEERRQHATANKMKSYT